MEQIGRTLLPAGTVHNARTLYQSQGYLYIPGLLSESEVARWRDHVRRAVHDRQYYPDDTLMVNDRFTQRVNAWKYDEAIRQMILGSSFDRLVAPLTLAKNARLFYSQLMIRHGYSTGGAFHVDMSGWSCNHRQGSVLWIALDDTTVESGCVWYLPGTHKDEAYDGGFGNRNALSAVFDNYPAWRNIEAVPQSASAGDAILHNALIAHAGGPNMTPRDRHVVILGFMPQGATYNGKPNRFIPRLSQLDLGSRLDLDDEFPRLSDSG